MLQAIIVDQDYLSIKTLETMINKHFHNEMSITGIAGSIDDAYRLIIEKQPDVIFLEIEMGGKSGFDLLKKFKQYTFKVICVSAYDKHAIRAIKFNALDYILKPLEKIELINAVQKMRDNKTIFFNNDGQMVMQKPGSPMQKSNRMAIPVLNGYKLIAVESILYCVAQKEYTNIHCLGQQVICSAINLGEYEELLQGYPFCRVHHSFLVNKDHVTQYIKGEGGELIISNDTSIPVSRRRKPDVLDWLKKNV